jgi:hypothetical protein
VGCDQKLLLAAGVETLGNVDHTHAAELQRLVDFHPPLQTNLSISRKVWKLLSRRCV